MLSLLPGGRLFWLLPLGVAGAWMLSWPTRRLPLSRVWLRTVVLGLSLYLFAVTIPSRFTFTESNSVVSIGIPAPKAYPDALFAVYQLHDVLPPSSYVIAPTKVSWLLPTFRQPLYPVVPRHGYMERVYLEQQNRPKDAALLLHLLRYADGKEPYDEAIWQTVLVRWTVDAVVVVGQADEIAALDTSLTDEEFVRYRHQPYVYWLRGYLNETR